MLSVAEARARIAAEFQPLPAEQIGLREALGRVLADDLAARRTQPPLAVSAMDGYAVRAADVAAVPARLRVVGAAPAGGAHAGTVRAGEAVRIFTGGALPVGADAIVIQEDTDRDGDVVVVKEAAPRGHYVRPAGLDFREGDICLRAGTVLTARDIGLAGAMNVPWLHVRRRPRVAILATGDEIVMPGETIGPNQIVSSNSLSLAAIVEALGAVPTLLGVAPDDRETLRAMAAGARGADLLVTTGGASVGDHDLVRSVLGDDGLSLDFWQIAMRPGKPLMFGHVQGTPLIGVPGNPVSTVVCALLFLRAALEAMLGIALVHTPPVTARLGRDLRANDRREDYLRSTLDYGPDGALVVTPFEKQDSSMLSLVAHADCFVVRAPHAPALAAGDPVAIMPMPASMIRL